MQTPIDRSLAAAVLMVCALTMLAAVSDPPAPSIGACADAPAAHQAAAGGSATHPAPTTTQVPAFSI